ncbi:MAG: LPXTG cell wall anchor domain-containing protein [Synergistaceae bacterium]|nr:LPXTG cell wall anchor domain-containing protein [Synergistaceae bacterium]
MRTADNRLYIEEAGPDIMDVLTAMGIAGMGGLVGWLRRKRYKNWRTFLAAIITAAFKG